MHRSADSHGGTIVASPMEIGAGGRRSVRKALNPVLLDAPMVSADGSRASVFLTPASARIERYLPLIIALAGGAFLLGGFVTARVGGPTALENLLVLLAFAIAAIPAVSSVWESLRNLQIDIDVLMLLGAGLAAFIGSPMEGALLLFLFALSGALEEYSLDRTQAAIIALHNLVPTEAIVVTDSGAERVYLKRVAVGQRVMIRPDDKVPLDGTVLEGSSSVNESAITGESVPRDKGVGDAVFAGTSNLQGQLIIEVTKTSGDTALAKILQLVTEARHQRASVQRLIDRIGPAYSVVVVVASVMTGVVLHFVGSVDGNESVRRAIALLIVCSPCALVIATPVAYLSAIAAAARRGVLIKGGVYLETLARAKTIVFDKTGTLTTGRVTVAGVQTHETIREDDALRYAGALEASSSHPLASAIMAELARRGLEPFEASELHHVPGQSMSGVSNGHRIWIGRPRLAVEEINPDLRDAYGAWLADLHEDGRAASALVIDGRPSMIAFEDRIREDAAQTLQRLRAKGLTRIEMLTGDHEGVARRIAASLALDGYHADLLPEDKLTEARALEERHGTIVMVGDGVNDAPALAAADVGIAIGSIGADVALEAADIVLMNDSLEGVAWVHAHARRTAGVVRQNLVLAIGVIVGMAGFAVWGRIPLPLAVIGHEGSTVLVALNALRLLRRLRG